MPGPGGCCWDVQGFICVLVAAPLLVTTAQAFSGSRFLPWAWHIICFSVIFLFLGGVHLHCFLFWSKASFCSFSAFFLSLFCLSEVLHILCLTEFPVLSWTHVCLLLKILLLFLWICYRRRRQGPWFSLSSWSWNFTFFSFLSFLEF